MHSSDATCTHSISSVPRPPSKLIRVRSVVRVNPGPPFLFFQLVEVAFSALGDCAQFCATRVQELVLGWRPEPLAWLPCGRVSSVPASSEPTQATRNGHQGHTKLGTVEMELNPLSPNNTVVFCNLTGRTATGLAPIARSRRRRCARRNCRRDRSCNRRAWRGSQAPCHPHERANWDRAPE